MRRSFFALLLAPALLPAQSPDPIALEARRWHRANALGVLTEFRDFLAIPNLADDSVNIRRNAAAILAMLERRGIKGRLLETPGSPPAVFAERRVPGATRTITLYAHYDGQPVAEADWKTGGAWVPQLREGKVESGAAVRTLEDAARAGEQADSWRLYARSASDDKGPIIAMMAALDALKAAGREPVVNLKFFFEGEEEAGSDSLRTMLTTHKALLASDLWIFADGPTHQSGMLQLVHGVRGVLPLKLTTYGPSRALHSGHYGNWAPNPSAMLAHLIASMRDDEGRILIKGINEGVRPVTREDSQAVASLPAPDAGLREELMLGRTEGNGASVGLAILRPALNVTGLSGGIGSNAVPAEATASIDFRLVPDLTPEGVRASVEAHLKGLGYHVVHSVPDSATRRNHAKVVRAAWGNGYAGQRTSLSQPLAREVYALVRRATGTTVGRIPALGGSLPLAIFEDVLRTPIVSLPIVNYDNNQHAANEHLKLGNLWAGIEVFATLMAGLHGTTP